jgi:glycosyltransferase involved in cell wall biosynthesis
MFGEDEYEVSLRALVTQLGLDNRVEFRGFRADVWDELSNMDILVHASRIPEPFGQVILEGMAARVPVIAPEAGGPAEIVRHAENGMLYEMGNRAALSAALRELAHDPELRARLAKAGEATLAEYRPDVIVAALQTVYHDVIDRVGTRRVGRRQF